MVVYCKSVHFHGFEDARDNLGFYEMSSFKEGKAMKLVEESGEERLVLSLEDYVSHLTLEWLTLVTTWQLWFQLHINSSIFYSL